MNWRRLLFAALTRDKYKQFIADTKHPESAQERLWTEEILPLLKQSSYWSSRLAHTPLLRDFPISNYEDYEAELLAAQQGTVQPFNGEDIIFWSETSGTSGARKFFPITSSFQKQFQRTIPPFIYSLTQRFPSFAKQKILYLVAVDTNKTTPAGTPAGWISNFNYRNLPPFVKRLYAMPDEAFMDAETFNQWGPLYALASDLSAIFAVTPMVIEAFNDRCISGLSDYLPYLSGEKQVPKHLPPVTVSMKRLRYLSELAKQPRINAKDLWPSLSFAGCWISGLCSSPAKQLQQRLGESIALVDGTYSATEGWLTVALSTEHRGSVLHPGAHIFEFIEEGLPLDVEHLIPAWKLSVGKKYEVFLTTAMGFVRYRLKDIVECTGFYNRAPILEFCYKSQLLKLEDCAINGQELQAMLELAHFDMAAHWYFARNSLGNRIVLVTDNEAAISDNIVINLHSHLINISPAYAHFVQKGGVIEMAHLQLPLDELLAERHGQTKPTLIAKHVVDI